MSDRPDILYVLAHGFAGRMVLHSDLVPRLRAQGKTVAVMSASADEPHFRALAARKGATPILAPDVTTKALSHYAALRRYLFEDYEKNASLRAKHEWELHHLERSKLLLLRPVLGKAVNMVLLRADRARNALASLERKMLRSQEMRRILSEVRPRMLVSTYPVAWLEALAIVEAQALGIRTVGHLLSWDNITCKGRFAAVPEKFVSWGPIMTEELASYYGARPPDVVETGVAHFDQHVRPVDRDLLDDALRGLDLDPTRPYLFVGMSASFFAPKEVDIVAWLAARVREGAFGPEMQLVVRPHPQNIKGPMADPAIVAKLKGIADARVAVDLPDVLTDRLDMGDHDMERLAALLHGAAVTMNSGSTLTIDALIHDRPVILTGFDADADLPWHDSARRLREFPHLDKLIARGGIPVAISFDDLRQKVLAYLENPSLDREARRRALHAECGNVDGKACERIADALVGFLPGREYAAKGAHDGILAV